jgi:hypothetical protein
MSEHDDINDPRLRVTRALGLPDVLAERLEGDSPKALEADAIKLGRALGHRRKFPVAGQPTLPTSRSALIGTASLRRPV